MAGMKVNVNSKMDVATAERIDGYAERRGVSRSAATEELVLLGLDADRAAMDSAAIAEAVSACLREEVARLESGVFGEAAARSEKRIERELASIERTAKDVNQIRADASKAAQASLAHLAYSMFMARHDGDHWAGFAPRSTPGAVADLRPRDLYSGFWNVGGMLKRNPSPAWFQHAFKDLEANVPGCDIERLVGTTREAWEMACEPPSKDSLRGGVKPKGMWG